MSRIITIIDPPKAFGYSLFDAITNASLTSGLQLCLDAADAASWPGSGTKWLDLSGNGYDFFLGSDGATAGEKPTFNGVVGGLTDQEYWSFDGGDFFRYDASNETWMESLHKDSAQFSILAIIQKANDSGDLCPLLGTSGTSNANIGVDFQLGTSISNNSFVVRTGTTAALSANGGFKVTDDSAFHTLALTIDEAAGASGSWWALDGVIQGAAFDGTYSSPSASSATYTLEIAADGNAANPATSETRLAAIAVWTGAALSVANFLSIHSGLGGRVG